MSELKVNFETKSIWQKVDCINPGCENESTLEAVCPNATLPGEARVRCCNDEKCKEYAEQSALACAAEL